MKFHDNDFLSQPRFLAATKTKFAPNRHRWLLSIRNSWLLCGRSLTHYYIMGTFVLLKFRFIKKGTMEKIPMSLGINFIVLTLYCLLRTKVWELAKFRF